MDLGKKSPAGNFIKATGINPHRPRNLLGGEERLRIVSLRQAYKRLVLFPASLRFCGYPAKGYRTNKFDVAGIFYIMSEVTVFGTDR
ncbi:MAG: hypothetical protein IEMM0002_1405 [bacterium]|nr:MAG: hypothetical protein IEMM0002_1405 [bacterium]